MLNIDNSREACFHVGMGLDLSRRGHQTVYTDVSTPTIVTQSLRHQLINRQENAQKSLNKLEQVRPL